MSDIPEGFAPHYRRSGMTDPWEPLYSRTTGQAVILGLRIAAQHCNSRGFVHGGLLASLADNAMGLSCGVGRAEASRLVTVNLSVDYLSAGQVGQWLTFETVFVKHGRSLDVAQCFVNADGKPIARASATFQVVRMQAAITEAGHAA